MTLKVRQDVPNLRARARFRAIRDAFKAARGRHGVRLADSRYSANISISSSRPTALPAYRAVCKGLCVRLTRALNRVLARRGSIFADRFHSRLLRTPTELVRAIRYVIDNARHHFGQPDVNCSSRAPDAEELLDSPRGWLLRIGWTRAPLRDLIAPVVASIDLLADFTAAR
ncbi:MAG TPA: hypothetical protein VGH20_17070 [Myxococcales bacterium]